MHSSEFYFPPYFWTAFGAFFGFAAGGGSAFIKHSVLRLLIYTNHKAPWNYARFLDYASERLLMKKSRWWLHFLSSNVDGIFCSDGSARSSVRVISESIFHSFAKANPQTVRSSNASNPSNPVSQLSNPVQNQITCSNCSFNNPTNGKFCTKCGRQIIL
jgi:hypothetical protein